MSKISKKIMIVLALSLVFVMVFAGCTSTAQNPVPGGKADALVENNGGLAVKQGNFIYYINGLTAVADIKEKEHNTFGKVVKGSIMRGELDENGNLKAGTTNIVVPLIALSGNKNGGINVYGNWIYYTTPSVKMDKYEVLQTSYLEYKRTSLDGTITQDIAIEDGQATEYKFTNNALFYFKNGKITRVNYDNEKVGATEVVAEKVSSVLFPNNETFDPATGKVADNTIFYTKASDNDEDMFNVVYAYDITSNKSTAIINGSVADADKKKAYSITLKFVNVLADGIEVYYERANANDPQNKPGIFGAMFKDGKLDMTTETRFTGEPQSVVYPTTLAGGLYVLEGNKLTLRKERVDEATGIISFYDEDTAVELPSGAIIVDFVSYKYAYTTEAIESVLYLVNNKLFLRPLVNDDKYAAVSLSKETDYLVDSSWLMPEIISGKVYFFNNNFYKYLDAVDLATGVFYTDKDGKIAHPFAKLNEADAKTEKEKAEKEAEKK